MGVGPAYAIPKILERTGISKEEVDFYEINEAFASQAVYSVQKLGLPFEKVNLNGGAIALGHPLGCSTSPQAPNVSVASYIDITIVQLVPVRLLLVSTLQSRRTARYS